MEEESKTFRVSITSPDNLSVAWKTRLCKNQTVNIEVDDQGVLYVSDPGALRVSVVAAGHWTSAEAICQEEK